MSPRRLHALAIAGGVLMVGALAGCGGSDNSGSSTAVDSGAATQPSGDASQGSSGPGGMGGQGFPGASGLVADVSGKTLQVQGQSGQTAVTYTDATTFTQQVDAALSDVTVGSCVSVAPTAAADGTETGGGTDASGPIAAATVRISEAASDGSCNGGFGGGPGGERPSGAPSDLPSDLPSDFPTDGTMPSGGPGGDRGGFSAFGAFGQVSAVSDSGFTVSQGDRTTEVTVSGETTYTATADATADAVKTGVCVSAVGETDDTGAVTADSIAVSEAVDGECGFGGFGGARGGAA